MKIKKHAFNFIIILLLLIPFSKLFPSSIELEIQSKIKNIYFIEFIGDIIQLVKTSIEKSLKYIINNNLLQTKFKEVYE
jgi:hypothetical protein